MDSNVNRMLSTAQIWYQFEHKTIVSTGSHLWFDVEIDYLWSNECMGTMA